jgi:hypothetical protein
VVLRRAGCAGNGTIGGDGVTVVSHLNNVPHQASQRESY